jgi:hypothetical protein
MSSNNKIKLMFADILKKDPRGVIAISLVNNNEIDLQWSDMPMEVICYAHHVLGMAIQTHIREAAQMRHKAVANDPGKH